MTYSDFGKAGGALTALAVGVWLGGCTAYDDAVTPADNAGSAENGGAGQPATPSGGSDAAPSSGGRGSVNGSGGSDRRVPMYGGAGYSGSSAQGGASGGSDSDAQGGAWEQVGGSAASGGGAGTTTGGTTTGGTTAGGSTAGGSTGSASVELAAKKPSTSSSQEAGNERNKGNDSDAGTRWCASDGTFPQWWRVDLGASHSLTDFGISFQHPDREYTYDIETSANDAVYIKQVSASGAIAVHAGSFPTGTSARYVRIKITKAAPGVYESGTYPTWACFFELSIKGN